MLMKGLVEGIGVHIRESRGGRNEGKRDRRRKDGWQKECVYGREEDIKERCVYGWRGRCSSKSQEVWAIQIILA